MTRWCEAGAHLGQIDDRDVEESALLVKASLQEQAVPVGVPSSELSSALEHNEPGATDGLSGGFRGEVPYQPVDKAADLSVKLLVVAKECTEHLGR